MTNSERILLQLKSELGNKGNYNLIYPLLVNHPDLQKEIVLGLEPF